MGGTKDAAGVVTQSDDKESHVVVVVDELPSSPSTSSCSSAAVSITEEPTESQLGLTPSDPIRTEYAWVADMCRRAAMGKNLIMPRVMIVTPVCALVTVELLQKVKKLSAKAIRLGKKPKVTATYAPHVALIIKNVAAGLLLEDKSNKMRVLGFSNLFTQDEFNEHCADSDWAATHTHLMPFHDIQVMREPPSRYVPQSSGTAPIKDLVIADGLSRSMIRSFTDSPAMETGRTMRDIYFDTVQFTNEEIQAAGGPQAMSRCVLAGVCIIVPYKDLLAYAQMIKMTSDKSTLESDKALSIFWSGVASVMQ